MEGLPRTVNDIRPETVQKANGRIREARERQTRHLEALRSEGRSARQLERAQREFDRRIRPEDFPAYVLKVCGHLGRQGLRFEIQDVAEWVLTTWPYCQAPGRQATDCGREQLGIIGVPRPNFW